ncbi:MAG: hypothetical protein GXO07_06620 [Crenarchaeota archaeon]|nr:hypothetical protein [Thermoproteota archaeon]
MREAALLALPYGLFKDREPFSSLRIEGSAVVRMDGVKFGKYSKLLGKQRDERVHGALVGAAEELLKHYSCDSAYVSSDEVSVFCKSPPFGGRVEKLVSVFPSFLSAHFSRLVAPLPPGWFDGRVVAVGEGEWPLYVAWRLKVTLCNFASRAKGRPCREALKGLRPPPEAYGTLMVREEYEKEGYDPIRKVKVPVKRRRLKRLEGEEVLEFALRGLRYPDHVQAGAPSFLPQEGGE